jgi:hypothetical protein
MRKLFFILSLIYWRLVLLIWKSAMLSYSDISIEKIVLNNQTYTVVLRTLWFDRHTDVTGTFSSSKK